MWVSKTGTNHGLSGWVVTCTIYYGTKTRLSLRMRVSKSVAPSARLVIASDDERDPKYVPPGTSTLSRAARIARATPKKVASGVIIASQSNEEHTLTDTPSRSAYNEEGASSCLGVSWSEEASGSAEVLAPVTAAQSALPDEADTS